MNNIRLLKASGITLFSLAIIMLTIYCMVNYLIATCVFIALFVILVFIRIIYEICQTLE